MRTTNKTELKNGGYTIIETMVSISLFLIVVSMGTNALLNTNVIHQKGKDLRSITDNLSFVMEDMSRNLRTGLNYHCINDANSSFTDTAPLSCEDGFGISFESSLGGQWVYIIGVNPDGTDNNIRIFKSTTGGTPPWIQMTEDDIEIDLAASGFSVLGAEPPGTVDKQQPLVSIRLVGEINYKESKTPFYLQTSASQRSLDI